ncbi:SBBP repeat-containing protein [Leptospira stimsonii]|uniref:SBBP repeat-containing protein n=1 Tax=Leptospira stimsonii TaxID=2202203 RepID=UPI001F4EF00A|nr:SBBP repeat-containing protein [Leptospira stimsonii]
MKTAVFKILLQDPTSFCGTSLSISTKPPVINNTGLRQWSTLLGVAGATTNSFGVASDDSGNVYVSGFSNGNLDGHPLVGLFDIFVAKYDNVGNKLWSRTLGVAASNTSVTGVVSDSTGNVYSTGKTNGNLDGQLLSGIQDLFLVKYDTSGNKQWTRLLGAPGTQTSSNAVALDSLGNVFVAGDVNNNLDGQVITGSPDLFVVKYDSAGNKQWTRLLGAAGANTSAFGVATDSSGNVYLTGSTFGNLDGQALTGTQDLFVVKYDGAGNKQWTRLLGSLTGSSLTAAFGIVFDRTSNAVYTTGATGTNLDGQTLTGNQDLFIVKYDLSGTRQWTRLLGDLGATQTAFGISSDSFGNVFATGFSSGGFDGKPPIGAQDLFVVKYDNNGNKEWSILDGAVGVSSTNGNGIRSDVFGNLYVTGFTNGSLDGLAPIGLQDFFLIQYK